MSAGKDMSCHKLQTSLTSLSGNASWLIFLFLEDIQQAGGFIDTCKYGSLSYAVVYSHSIWNN